MKIFGKKERNGKKMVNKFKKIKISVPEFHLKYNLNFSTLIRRNSWEN